MTLRISRIHLDEIRRHGAAAYPHECCGALVGISSDGGEKTVHEVVRLPNSYSREVADDLGLLENERGTHNRYIIDPKDLFRTEKEARAKSMSIIGFYHSHPDAPAVPSKYDLRVAGAGYSYVIVSVEQGEAGRVACWQTDAAREKFESEELIEMEQPALSERAP